MAEKVTLKLTAKQLQMVQAIIEAWIYEDREGDYNTVDEMISLILMEVLEKKILSKVLFHKKEYKISLKRVEGIALQFAIQRCDLEEFPAAPLLSFSLPKVIHP